MARFENQKIGLMQNRLPHSGGGRLLLLVVAAFAFLYAFLPVQAKADSCAMLNGVSFRFVFSNDKLRTVLSNVIKNNKINSIEQLDRLSDCYRNLCKKYDTDKLKMMEILLHFVLS